MEKEPQVSALEPGELEMFIQCMEPCKIESIGNSSWLDWHIRLQKLNQQAVLEATAMLEEQTKEALISYGKLYHEACAVGLLETVLFHEAGAESLSEVLVDLLDYSVDMITSLVKLLADGYLKTENLKQVEIESVSEELVRQRKDLLFDIGMRCISIIRYIAEHMEASGGSAGVATNLYRTHDVPSLLAHLLQEEPWRRRSHGGQLQTFNFGRWAPPRDDELDQMHRTEAQLWLCLRQMLLESQLHKYYSFDNVRKAQFCRLEPKLSETILDQIPPLGELKTFLCRLAVMDVSCTPGPAGRAYTEPGCLLIEVVPQIKESYIAQVAKRTKTLAKAQLSSFKLDGSAQSMEHARRLLASYTSEAVLALDGGGAKCAACGQPAGSKCSRCKTEWYCGRECQVKTWPRHKDLCDQFAHIVL